MKDVPQAPTKDLFEAAERFDKARAKGKRPMLTWDAVNLPEGVRVKYSDDDTRKAKNPYDEIINRLGDE
ncbi:hypothetical protein A3A76_03030 [Candidatus Woesebacteria bacterium RIFCSPLOWO2_01_FULL_39_23]|uniref:Uncharacterized protein n=1 Tax=Candidatus Woesebacteria bacterium RIFCSPHIGHO2_01_FULL_40_22 TaxID=1802499 RepID=A0A1F7YJC2_9BACT|nr:MAG: hypothetical protein A2141_00990 [Candidatus Woesebacteria bacterium RBG_16_40_11]OGM27436.1 MAG: hypothetical protein A2628_01435 [Candidatus Woesebacteria bacterium RIFCSPHIGHO2_01_FULL_40_22]OGM36453.1 MAG: hypothetical protein A3E41_02915 [Candidatus Woesebacteria bacterium RIFCSPHIGHO2_12_FULL_38_9]OGM62608.1 MAG: hypothetical protein A3A76_03030 [Candidatus Woesebacteria bacterium RIFCSPLOWO2_01_FULL_39_23]